MCRSGMCAGAGTVVCPLWGGGATGGDLGQLARTILLLKFYFELPNFAHEGRPVAKTLQVVQVLLALVDNRCMKYNNNNI